MCVCVCVYMFVCVCVLWCVCVVVCVCVCVSVCVCYAIGSRKQSANKQLFVDVRTVVSLLQTTQINQGVSFIAANKVYTSTNKTTIV